VRAVTQTVDGRTARSARTREAVVRAVLELVRAGNTRPTAKEIAAGAGISLRSVYVHFDDLDDLFAAAGARQAEEVAHLLAPVDPELDLEARIEAVVRQRAAIWEALAPVRRAALVWASSSPQLREGARRVAHRSITDLARVFGREIDGCDGGQAAAVLEAINVAGSDSAWEVLRRERGLSVDDASAVVATTLRVLLTIPR
jgi:AcrR family transcriptional regulator